MKLMKLKKLSVLTLASVMVLGLLSGCTSKEAGIDTAKTQSEPIFINIGTGGTAGTYFPLGGAFSEIWSNNIPGVNATAETTGASVANVNLMKEGKIEIGIIQNDIASYAETGTVLFDAPIPQLKGMASLYSEPLQCITTDANVKSIADLKGKRVAVGAIGSGVEANARQIIAAAGLDFDKDIEAKFLSFAEAATGLKDRQIDVAFLVAGIPTAAITDLSTQREVSVVPIDGEVAAKLKSDFAFYTDYVIPAETYKGQANDVTTLCVKSVLVVDESVDEEIVYQMLKTMYDNGDRITAAHAVGKLITKESGKEGMSVALHPGAERFFNEK